MNTKQFLFLKLLQDFNNFWKRYVAQSIGNSKSFSILLYETFILEILRKLKLFSDLCS